MKKILLLLFIVIPVNVFAISSASVVLNPNKQTLLVGETANVALKINADTTIQGIDFTYSSSGSISVL